MIIADDVSIGHARRGENFGERVAVENETSMIGVDSIVDDFRSRNVRSGMEGGSRSTNLIDSKHSRGVEAWEGRSGGSESSYLFLKQSLEPE